MSFCKKDYFNGTYMELEARMSFFPAKKFSVWGTDMSYTYVWVLFCFFWMDSIFTVSVDVLRSSLSSSVSMVSGCFLFVRVMRLSSSLSFEVSFSLRFPFSRVYMEWFHVASIWPLA